MKKDVVYSSKPSVRIFCIPFAGGNAYSYKDLKEHIADFAELVPLELPGRGRRFGEGLLTSLERMADDLFAQVRNELQGPYAVYGHSMGGRLSYLVARRALAAGLPAPMHLFVSGCEAPCVVQNRRRYELPRDEFIAVLHGMDCPPQVLQSEELMEVFEPVLRADFEANDTFEYQRQAPFKIPITVMIGTEEETSREEALKWQQVTVQEIVLVEFSGGHFFIFDHLPELGRIVSQRLQRWKA